MQQPQRLGLGGQRGADHAAPDRLLDMGAAELRFAVMDHVEPATPQGPQSVGEKTLLVGAGLPQVATASAAVPDEARA